MYAFKMCRENKIIFSIHTLVAVSVNLIKLSVLET